MESNDREPQDGCDEAPAGMMVQRQDVDGILHDLARLTGVPLEAGLQPQLRKVRELVDGYRDYMQARAWLVAGSPHDWNTRMDLPQLAAMVRLWDEDRTRQKRTDCLALLRILPEDQREAAQEYELEGMLSVVADYAAGLRQQVDIGPGEATKLVVSHADRVAAVEYLRKHFDAFPDVQPSEVPAGEILAKLRGVGTWGNDQAEARAELDAWWKGLASRVAVGAQVIPIQSRAELDQRIDLLIGQVESAREDMATAGAILADLIGVPHDGDPAHLVPRARMMRDMVDAYRRSMETMRLALGAPGEARPPRREDAFDSAEFWHSLGENTYRPHEPGAAVGSFTPTEALGFLHARCCDRLLSRLKADGRSIDGLPMNLERLVAEVCDGTETEGRTEADAGDGGAQEAQEDGQEESGGEEPAPEGGEA